MLPPCPLPGRNGGYRYNERIKFFLLLKNEAFSYFIAWNDGLFKEIYVMNRIREAMTGTMADGQLVEHHFIFIHASTPGRCRIIPFFPCHPGFTLFHKRDKEFQYNDLKGVFKEEWHASR
jgi:hypothetical protein